MERKAAPRPSWPRPRRKTREAREQLAKARLPVDESGVAVAQRALELAERDYAVKREELELKRRAKRGEVEAARLELANLELEREQAVIRAPIDGVVTAGDVKVGDVLEPGKPVVEIARQAGFLFEAAVPSEEIGHLRVGMPARIKLDAYDYQRYGTLDGTVCFISPDSGVAEGQTGGLYTVRIATSRDEIGRGAYRGRVKLGMAGQAEIVTGRDRLLTLLVGTTPPDDQPELKRLERTRLSPISNTAGPDRASHARRPTRPSGDTAGADGLLPRRAGCKGRGGDGCGRLGTTRGE